MSSVRPGRPTARTRLRRLAGRAPAVARRRVGRLARRARAGRPRVSAVVLLTGKETAARAALDAVREQPDPRLEILAVVLDERLRSLADRAAAGDWRVRPVEVGSNDVALARRAGCAAARTPWLLFLSPHQLLVPGALARLMGAAGADPVPVLGGLAGSTAPWSAAPLLGRVLVPTALWEQATDDGEPDGQGAAVSLLRTGFTDAGAVTLRDAHVPRARPFERAADPLPALPARVLADTSMLTALDSDPELRAERAAGALSRDLPRFLLAVERCDDAQWDLLSSHAATLLGAAGEPGRSRTPVEDRVAAWLAAEGRRDSLTAFVAARRFAGGSFATSVDNGAVLARLDEAPDDVPLEVLRLHEDESRLRGRVRRLRLDGDELLLEVFAGLSRVDQGGDLPEVHARLVRDGDRVELSAEVSPDAAVTRWMGEPQQYHDYGVVAVRVPLARLRTGSWHLELEMQHSGVRRTGLVSELDGHGSAARTLLAGRRSLRWDSTAEGLRLVVGHERPTPATGVVVRGLSAAPGRLVLEVEAPEDASAELRAPGQVVAGTREGGRWHFDLVTDPWGLGPRPAPSGTYRLSVTAAGAALPVALSEEVTDLLPQVEVDERHRRAVWRAPDGGLELRLDPALSDEEAGPWTQHQLQQSYARVSDPVDPRLVYFQSFLGQSPTDHPAALQAELHRVLAERGASDVRVLWAVADSSVVVPDGAEPVLLRSREWYAAMARAAWIVTNIELDPWFRRREGQEVLETYHGYPSKAMGLAQWRARGLTPTHVAQMLQRTSGTWNNLLTPVPEMDRYYRECYEFEGRIISRGYPRQDGIVGPGHEARRRSTRERLGIAPHQKAVLYAPTWRDDLATNFRSAEAVLHLDVARAARLLGPDHVVLLRGHRFHAAAGSGARVLDVTAYPEVNDLVLASDAAVLDYSSLRFDFALTGRPMVFLVPDLAHYTEEIRGFLFPFADSAPGPFVDTTEGAVEALSDLPALERRWGPRLAEFNARYNPQADGRAAERVVAELFAPLLSD